MSERRVRLLYKTTCWTCGAPISAGTTTWWDDDHKHATCAGCFGENDAQADGAMTVPATVELRTRRRLEIVRARWPRAASR